MSSSRLQYIFPTIAIVIGLLLLLYAIVPHGIGLSEDSISYLAAANSLHDVGAMRDIDGSVFVAWTPLYPLTIAALQFLPFKIENTLVALNLLVFMLTVISSWLLIVKAMEKMFFRVVCLLFIVCSFTIMQVYAIALSEAVFLLLINLIALVLTSNERHATRNFFLLALLCGFTLLQRYIGIFVIPVVLIFVVRNKTLPPLASRGWDLNITRQRRAMAGLLFLFLALVPLSIWLMRNYLLTETLTGFRADSSEHFAKNIVVLAETITSWMLPVKIPLIIRVIALTGIFVLLRKNLRESNRIHLLVFVVYVLMLVVAYFLFSFEEPRDRLLAPTFISFSIMLFSGMEYFIRHSSFVIRHSCMVVLCCWLLYPVVRIIKHVQLWHQEGIDVYNKPHWSNSETIAWLKEKENVPYGSIFSNDPSAIYYFTGKNAVRVPKSIYSFGQFNQSVTQEDLLVWWNGRELYDVEVISAKYSLEEKARLDDGTVFRINPKP